MRHRRRQRRHARRTAIHAHVPWHTVVAAGLLSAAPLTAAVFVGGYPLGDAFTAACCSANALQRTFSESLSPQ